MRRSHILAKLEAIAALEGRGATPGERSAARHARRRLEALLDDATEDSAYQTEIALAYHHLTAAEAETEHHREAPTAAPTAEEVLARVRRWRAGRLRARTLHRWASHIVDGHVLPQDDHDHPDVRAAEVLMVLASAVPKICLAGAIIAFLTAPREAAAEAWAAWFTALANLG